MLRRERRQKGSIPIQINSCMMPIIRKVNHLPWKQSTFIRFLLLIIQVHIYFFHPISRCIIWIIRWFLVRRVQHPMLPPMNGLKELWTVCMPLHTRSLAANPKITEFLRTSLTGFVASHLNMSRRINTMFHCSIDGGMFRWILSRPGIASAGL